nr:MAG TPA: hypothetical protein [Caudoviricetes sp.]
MNTYSNEKIRCVKFDCIQSYCTTASCKNHIENF